MVPGMRTREERARANQDLFRAGNEAIVAVVAKHGGTSQPLDFLCECFDTSCLGRIRLTPDAYDELTQDDRYVVLTGHEGPDELCAQHDGYSIVAK